MEKLLNLKKVVYEELKENQFARKNDAALISGCFRRLGIDTEKSFEDLAKSGKLKQMESITRCRRKLQQEFPELRDATTAELRDAEQQRYIDFSKVAGI